MIVAWRGASSGAGAQSDQGDPGRRGGRGASSGAGGQRDQGDPGRRGGRGASSGELTLTRESVAGSLAHASSWESAAHALDAPAGLVFMVGTGIPADGSGVPDLEDRLHGGPDLASPQGLVNPRGHNPLRNPDVERWVAQRAGRELTA